MKFAFIADIHLSKYAQDRLEDTTGLPERLDSIKKALYEVGEYCRANEIPFIMIGGDVYHNKSLVYTIAQQIMLNFFEDFGDLSFVLVDGNHDLSGKGQNVVSALRSAVNCPNVEWVTEAPSQINKDVLCVPYSYEVVNHVKSNNAKILISHFGLSEGILNSGMSIIQNISLSDLAEKYELVLLGHYHKPQEIIQDNIKLYYVGSLIQLDWGEKGDEKRFLVVNTDTMQVDSIPITQYRKHIEIEVTAENKTAALDQARKLQDAGDHVKVIMREAVDLTDYKGEFSIVDKTQKDITDRGLSTSMSEEDIHKRYIDIKEVPNEDKDLYLKVGMEIIEQCEGE